MGLFRSLFVASLVVSAFAEQARILRRRQGRLDDFNPKMDMSLCQSHTNHYFMMVGERTLADGKDFMMHNPDLTQHRELLGFSNDDIANMWEEAIEFAWEYAGIDFRNEEYNPEDGMINIDGFMMLPVTLNFGLRLTYSSELGHLDCPLTHGDEAIVVIATKDGEYKGSFGAMFGGSAPAFEGELGVAYGDYAIDLDQDGDYERISYWTNSPMRSVLGSTRIDCNLYSEEYGTGRNDGKLDFNTVGSDGVSPHGIVRSLATFPVAWDYGVQWKTPANNYATQYPFPGENPNDMPSSGGRFRF